MNASAASGIEIDGVLGQILFYLVFFGIAGSVFIIAAVVFAKNVRQWHRNNQAPMLTAPAVLVTKRHEASRGSESTTHWYYATFELPGHERLELPVNGRQWGMLAEDDRGELTYQGTRFHSFDRVPQDRPRY